MKKLTSLLLLLLNSIIIISQVTTFKYTRTSNNDECINDVFEDEAGNIYYCGRSSKNTNYFNNSIILGKINKYGGVINTKIQNRKNKSIFANQLLIYDSTKFIVTAQSTDTLSRNEIGFNLYFMDLNLNLSNDKHYEFDSLFKYFGHTKSALLNNGNIISFMSDYIYYQTPRTHLYLFNRDLDTVETKYFPNGSRWITNIKELDTNNIWTLNLTLRQYEILNKNFDIVSTQKIPMIKSGNISVCWDTDSTFFMLGEYAPPYFQNRDNLAFVRQFHPMDTTGYIFNYWRYSDTNDFPAFFNGLDFKNKDSIFIGGTENLDIYNPWYGNQPSWFVILQTDSLLNKRWERFYGGDAYYVMTNLIASNDGRCILAGTRYDYLNAPENMLDIVILKLDNNGLITNMEETEESKFSEAIVYPNPGITEMNIKVATQYNVSKFALYDISGNLVLSKEIHGNNHTINTNNLKQGSYIYSITNNNGLNETGVWIKK